MYIYHSILGVAALIWFGFFHDYSDWAMWPSEFILLWYAALVVFTVRALTRACREASTNEDNSSTE